MTNIPKNRRKCHKSENRQNPKNNKDYFSPRRSFKTDTKTRVKNVDAKNKLDKAQLEKILKIKNNTKSRREQQGFKTWLREALWTAYYEARAGKRQTVDEHKVEMNIDEDINWLVEKILNKTYHPGRSRAHIITKPVIREIFSAHFLDRIVHHFLFMIVYPWWDRHFIDDSYSCRIGKGTDYGIHRLQHYMRKVATEHPGEKVYVFKGDIQGYFMSLSRKKLLERALWGLDQQFAGKTDTKLYAVLKFLWRKIILDDPVAGAGKVGNKHLWRFLPSTKSLFKQLPGFGIVIGNLTSQLLSNIFLDQLDRFVTMTLGYKCYGRYVDDFFIVIAESELQQFLRDLKAIEEYLKSIGLTLHPKKRSLQETKKGVEFLGARVFPYNIVPGERVKKNAAAAFREVVAGEKDPDSVVSYMGHMKYFRSKKVLKELFKKAGWDFHE